MPETDDAYASTRVVIGPLTDDERAALAEVREAARVAILRVPPQEDAAARVRALDKLFAIHDRTFAGPALDEMSVDVLDVLVRATDDWGPAAVAHVAATLATPGAMDAARALQGEARERARRDHRRALRVLAEDLDQWDLVSTADPLVEGTIYGYVGNRPFEGTDDRHYINLDIPEET